MDVAGDARRKQQVQEHGPVVGGDGRRKGEAQAEASRDDRPPPGSAESGEEEDRRSGEQCAGVDALDAGDERPGAEAPDHDRENRERDRRADPRDGDFSRQHQEVGVTDGDGEAACFRLSLTAQAIQIGVSGQIRVLLARGADPAREPLGGETRIPRRRAATGSA